MSDMASSDDALDVDRTESELARTPIPRPAPVAMALPDLRRDIRLAIISSFMANFGAYLGHDFEIDILEKELLSLDDSSYSAQMACNLVLSLSNERSINMQTYLPRLRRDFIRREREWTKLGNDRFEAGDPDGPMPWEALSSTDKVHVLWRLCEWHLFEPDRFRARIGQDDELATWRDEPIGRDAYGHAYWYFYDGRLWLQRIKPSLLAPRQAKAIIVAPAKVKPRTNGRATKATSSTNKQASTASISNKRKRPLTPLDEADESAKSPKKRAPTAAPSRLVAKRQRTGVRASRRLRTDGEEDEEGWQAIPEEWLAPSDDGGDAQVKGQGKQEAKDGNLSDASSSSLSSLSSEATSSRRRPSAKASKRTSRAASVLSTVADDDEDEEEEDEEPIEIDPMACNDPQWIEWEVICTTEEEWDALLARFGRSKSAREKALREAIEEEAVPQMRADAEARAEAAAEAAKAAAQAARAMQQAELLTTRKRSSRIAVKESVIEEQRRLEAERTKTERASRRLGSRGMRELSGTPFDDTTREGRLRLREEQRRERDLQLALEESQHRDDDGEQVGEEESASDFAGGDNLDVAPAAAESATASPPLMPGPLPRQSLKVTLKRSPLLASASELPSIPTNVAPASASPSSSGQPRSPAEVEPPSAPSPSAESLGSVTNAANGSPTEPSRLARAMPNLPAAAYGQGVGAGSVKERAKSTPKTVSPKAKATALPAPYQPSPAPIATPHQPQLPYSPPVPYGYGYAPSAAPYMQQYYQQQPQSGIHYGQLYPSTSMAYPSTQGASSSGWQQVASPPASTASPAQAASAATQQQKFRRPAAAAPPAMTSQPATSGYPTPYSGFGAPVVTTTSTPAYGYMPFAYGQPGPQAGYPAYGSGPTSVAGPDGTGQTQVSGDGRQG